MKMNGIIVNNLSMKQLKRLTKLARELFNSQSQAFKKYPSAKHFASLNRAMLVYQHFMKNVDISIDGWNKYDFDNLMENMPHYIALTTSNISIE